MTCLCLNFIISQKYTGQEFSYVLLFHIVTLSYSNKYLANILKAYAKDENNNTKNSTTFSNYIRNVSIEDDGIMVSFDVTSLYKNIPMTDTLNIIEDYVNNDDQFTRKTIIYFKDKFLDLVNLVLTTSW